MTFNKEIDDFLNNLDGFLMRRDLVKDISIGLQVLLLGILNLALFFTVYVSRLKNMTAFVVYFIFFVLMWGVYRLTFIPFANFLAKRLLHVSADRSVGRLIYFSMVPFCFIFPLIFLGLTPGMKGLIFLVIYAIHLHITTRIFSFCYKSTYVEVLFFLALSAGFFIFMFSAFFFSGFISLFM
ncbi:MAG: hypothetical protein C0601_08065 [Candidatus Muiribacterium halophilum]|uniref:Uncharacterized protein n=1 Tax=Muiribacterium halophilum TaxID=2053465 RepID=A0A2N5ZF08_MUIH1|nr:MAG: hypothetical protein C0601_08065 [Candidatus Muirbacterium halophilum]